MDTLSTSTASTLQGSPESDGSQTELAEEISAVTFQYAGIDQLNEVIDNLEKNQDFIICKDISSTQFKEVEGYRDEQGWGWRFFFNENSKTLFVTIPSFPHESAHAEIYNLIRDEIVGMGLRRQWRNVAATRYGGSASSKEGDSCGGPRHVIISGNGWPTLVMEAGNSESLAQLRAGMRWWFSTSQHQVKIVLLVKLYANTRTICIEKYTEEVQPIQRPSTTLTRHAPLSLTLVRQQEIHVTPIANGNDEFRVHGGPLLFEFPLLFLRAPDPAVGEHDIIIGDDDLVDSAMAIWGIK